MSRKAPSVGAGRSGAEEMKAAAPENMVLPYPEMMTSDAPPPLERAHSSSKDAARFGGKGFGLAASVALTVNNISGAGMLEFPQMFQRAGLLPSLLSLAFVCVVSTLTATTLSACDWRGDEFRHVRISFSPFAHGNFKYVPFGDAEDAGWSTLTCGCLSQFAPDAGVDGQPVEHRVKQERAQLCADVITKWLVARM